jgi:CRISPR-associated protein (TIGR02584 family)
MRKAPTPPKPPHQYARRVLVMVTGRTPQVVTETLYALTRRDPSFVPTEVHPDHLITTAEGAQDANLALLDPEKGWFHKLVSHYGISGVSFDAGHIHTIRDTAGEPVSDIRSELDHQACADLITAPGARLHRRRRGHCPACAVGRRAQQHDLPVLHPAQDQHPQGARDCARPARRCL